MQQNLKTAIDESLAVEGHRIGSGLHARVGHELLPGFVAFFARGQVIHEKTTVSFGSHLTAIGKEVILPWGTSSPQHSTTPAAPCSLSSAACLLGVLAVGVPIGRWGQRRQIHRCNS
jgi:hypothetical protein